MGRIARVVVPGYPHHVTQRGNRRQQTFFTNWDYIAYKGLMSEWCGLHGVAICSYWWSSERAYITGKADSLIGDNPIAGMIQQEWNSFLAGSPNEEIIKSIRSHERTGRPLGSTQFIGKLGKILNRSLTLKKPGRKPKLNK